MISKQSIDVGSILGPYQITDRLGAGAAGSVFVATDQKTGQQVALKVLRPGAELNEEIHSRFIREISVAQKLSDPHIVSYRDCGVEDGVLYYAMEHVSWGSLAEVLHSRGSIPWRDVCECGIQICAGLEHLHESKIVHRDLKPANIFLSEDGRLKLGDFGLARDFESHSLSLDGTTVGTMKYLAPEQARGAKDIDGRTDLYALGCNLFEFLTGRTPFGSEDADTPVNIVDMMRRHVEEAPPKVRDLRPDCPAALSDLVDQLLKKDRNERPRSAAQVANVLRHILQDPEWPLDTAALETSGPPPAATPEDGAPTSTLTERLRPTAATAPEVSTRKLVAVLLLVAGIVAVVALAGSGKL